MIHIKNNKMKERTRAQENYYLQWVYQ